MTVGDTSNKQENSVWFLLACCAFMQTSAGRAVAMQRAAPAAQDRVRSLDPKGQIHIPIGIADTLDSLKTFVEAEGSFSPGAGSYGVYFWLFDKSTGRLAAPTMDGMDCRHGLAEGGHLIPWSKWCTDGIEVKTEVCHVIGDSPRGKVHIVGSRATLTNRAKKTQKVGFYAALRPIGPAGSDVNKLSVSDRGDAFLVDGRAALVADRKPTTAGVVGTDSIDESARHGEIPQGKSAVSKDGDCSGALRFDVALGPGASKTFGFVCPVLPGRRAVRHQWDGVSTWAQFDLAKPNPSSGGVLQPDPGLEYYRKLRVETLFAWANRYCKQLVGNVKLQLPDARWAEAFAAIIGHAAMEMNEGAPDVAVVNYNVFNRDGVYVANILHKAGQYALAEEAIDYFPTHPFNGRSYPEADNPGQILWIMAEHWRFTGDRKWLERVYPSARKIAEMIKYCRTTNGPHWVQMDGLNFGKDVPADKRRQLEPGRCDGHNPAYTEAFDLAGIRAAAVLAEAAGHEQDALAYERFAEELFEKYDASYGNKLPERYGSYSVLWPCRLYPLRQGKAYEQFKNIGAQRPESWRYFPLAKAHQSLLAGNRDAGYVTLQYHFEHPQMQGWYAFDEGGESGSGGWRHLRTTWNGSVAMPHGWAIAELHLLLRDCLAFENNGQLVLFAGIPQSWFTDKKGMSIENLPTHYGLLTLRWKPAAGGAILEIGREAKPPNGFALCLPNVLRPTVRVGSKIVEAAAEGYFAVPSGAKNVQVNFN